MVDKEGRPGGWTLVSLTLCAYAPRDTPKTHLRVRLRLRPEPPAETVPSLERDTLIGRDIRTACFLVRLASRTARLASFIASWIQRIARGSSGRKIVPDTLGVFPPT